MNDTTFVPLADRIRWTAALRVLLVATTALLWWSTDAVVVDGRTMAVLGGAYLLVTALLVLSPRRERRTARAGLDAGLLLDGIALAVALQALGGTGTPAVALFALHTAGITLLSSFRTGVKVAVAHSFVVLLLVHGQIAGVLPGGSGGSTLQSYTGFTAVLWASTLGTATFAAVNERELRRRRHDTDVLHGLLVELAAVEESERVAAVLSEFLCRELPARRAELLLASQHPLAQDDVLRRTGPGVPTLVRRLDDGRDPWLAQRWPDAGGVVVLALPGVAGRGWLVLDVGGGRRGVERRVLRTVEQALSHAAMALARVQAVEALRRAAALDGLTGVANRRTLDEELARLARSEDTTPVTVALLDVDHFKAVNDRHGHQVGDEVLRCVARAAASAVRGSDLVARYGGEEFAVLLPATTPAEALQLVERLRGAVSAATRPRVTCSAGLAGGPPAEALRLLAAADRALYAAKAEGRDRSVVAGDVTRTAAASATTPTP